MLLYVIICYILNYIKFKLECIIFICVVYYISCGFLILYYTNIYYIISYNILLYYIILNIYLSLFKKTNTIIIVIYSTIDLHTYTTKSYRK